ncbi:biopolymer transporter ExbD [Terriglobus roseus]|uniref:Biopolymer transport protein ExbD/biopolymer transport protein TolR n=1 Tax=Terriglobus roseus TaxID=392734 RepID=A0A1H4N788_9BACT|nr:biopolymer transporter ExbD [Terriglobus roseus]SEB90575.1 biopolymer transport protein ExbD/biopolymer transport protein TolR [Terriglobus roseus]
MGMGGGGGKGQRSDINVTPLIDVLLVLLIIFMVIQPNTVRGLDTLVPQPPKKEDAQKEPDQRTVVVQVQGAANGAPTYKINEDQVTLDTLTAKLTDIFARRNDKVMFVKGDKDVDFGAVLPVINDGHAAGVDNIGIITPAVEAGK